MKMKTTGTLAVMFLRILACGALACGAPVHACTVFCYSQGDTVLAGRSFDIPDNPNLGMQLVPATATTHGWVSFDRFGGGGADGMNDQGLFSAVADVPATFTSRSATQPADMTFQTGLLANCATVDEAIAWAMKQPTPSLGAEVNHSDQGDYTFVTPQHILIADRSGDSVVFEWPQGKLKAVRKQGRYQLMTNFLLTDPDAGDYPCPRFTADSLILDKATGPLLPTCEQVLATTAQGITRYSLVYDLTHGDVHVYLRRRFDEPKTVHLADELQKGRHEIDLDQWFGRPKPEILAPPPVIAPSTLLAAEVIQRALAARGGKEAADRIRSLHAKGTADFDVGFLSSSSAVECFAMRPDRFRFVAEIFVPGGSRLGEYGSGFDGRIGWNSSPDGTCTILKGEAYELRRDEAAFFGWYAEPGDYETAECLGEARFDGKLCYDLKVVSASSRHEYFEYYDATNFFLVGIFGREATEQGAGWSKTTYGDYRAFKGFLIPMRFVSRTDAAGHSIQFSSMEINAVKERDLQMVEKVALRKQ
jgi:hypothetical protein